MTDQEGKRSKRSGIAARFDEVAAVFTIGMTTAEDRLGCGLNDIVNHLLAYPRACR